MTPELVFLACLGIFGCAFVGLVIAQNKIYRHVDAVSRALHDRISALEASQNPFLPTMPSTSPFTPPPIGPNIWESSKSCRVCGINQENLSHYVCPRMDCPGKVTFRCSTD